MKVSAWATYFDLRSSVILQKQLVWAGIKSKWWKCNLLGNCSVTGVACVMSHDAHVQGQERSDMETGLGGGGFAALGGD